MGPKPKFETLTTAGRIAKAKYDREQQANPTPKTKTTMSQAEAEPSSQPAKKKRRTTNHPPPSEMAAEAKAKAEAKEKQKSKRKTPLTTKEKQAAHAAKQRKAKQSVVHDGSALLVVPEQPVAARGDDRANGAVTKNLMNFMHDFGQMGAASAPAPKQRKKTTGVQERESVLVRATEKTQRTKLKIVTPVFESKAKNVGGTGLMSLPRKVREQIWREVVVETQCFVFPANDPEQPDLAMTSREIRKEVLPVYYLENTFAMEVPSAPTKGRPSKAAPTLKSIESWASALHAAEHLQSVLKWAFIWAPPPPVGVQMRTPEYQAINQDTIISLKYPSPATWQGKAPEIEIHRQAFCTLIDHKMHIPCILKEVPRWLSDAVAGAFLADDDRAEQVLAIAKALKKKGGELVKERCELLQLDDDL